jgi:hypothetical protein
VAARPLPAGARTHLDAKHHAPAGARDGVRHPEARAHAEHQSPTDSDARRYAGEVDAPNVVANEADDGLHAELLQPVHLLCDVLHAAVQLLAHVDGARARGVHGEAAQRTTLLVVTVVVAGTHRRGRRRERRARWRASARLARVCHGRGSAGVDGGCCGGSGARRRGVRRSFVVAIAL